MTKRNVLIWFALLSGISLSCLVGWRTLRRVSHPITVDALSLRAQEFIARQNADGTGLWQSRRLQAMDEEPAQALSRRVETDCFSLELPFEWSNPFYEKTATTCRWQAKTVHPLAHLVIGVRTGTLSEDSGIRLRESQPTSYQIETLESSRYSTVKVFRAERELTIFLEKSPLVMTIALTELPDTSIFSHESLVTLIESISLDDISPE